MKMKFLQLGIGLALLGTVLGTCPHLEQGLVDWHQASTWGSDGIPGADAEVVIPTGTHVLLNASTPCLATLVIEQGASLVWGDKDDVTLCASYILVKGRLQAGSETCRVTWKARIKLVGESNSTHYLAGFGRKFIGVAAGGTMEIHGEEKPTWTKLIRTVDSALSTCGGIFNYQNSSLNEETNRGLYVSVFNTDGTLYDFAIFRTGDDVAGEADRFKDFLEDVPDNKVVSVALQGDIGNLDNSPVYDAIETLGGLSSSVIRNVEGRQAYAFITKKGDTSKTQERHAFNPYSTDFVETGYLSIKENQRRFRVNSKVHKEVTDRRGVDFQVVTEEVANPCIYVDADVSRWRTGDVVVVGSTDFNWRQAEEMTIASSSGNKLCFSEPFQYMHYGQETHGVDERGEVGLLSRRFVIEGEKQTICTPNDSEDEELCQRFGQDTFGGHVKVVLNAASVHVQGVELRHMGQMRNVGSYPLHFHMCDDMDGSWFKYNSIHHTTRCVTIHGTDGVEFSYNFCFKTFGHSVFLEDCVEQRNTIKGNLVIGTMHGQHLLSDMKMSWCDEQLKTYCDALSSYWLTHPNNTVVDNVAGGSDNVGFWYITSKMPLLVSYDRQLARQKVGNRTAIHTKILEFRNNTAHSNALNGLRIDHRISHGEMANGVYVPPNGVFGGTLSHTPRVDPWDGMSDFSTSHIHTFTAYKNRHRNLWTKAGIVVMEDFSLADAPRGVTIAAARAGTWGELKLSRLIGETDNIGMPVPPFGRSAANDDPFEVLQGTIFYQGPGIYTDCFFDKYEEKTFGSETRRAGAISVKRNNPYPPKANSRVKGIKFGYCDGTQGNWAFNGNPVHPFMNKDGNRQINFWDEDGSVSGTANTHFVPISRFHTTARCDNRTNMNFAVCPYKYAKVVFEGDGALKTLDKQYPMRMIRDDRPNDPFVMKGEKGNRYLAIVGKSYTAYFNGTAPTTLEVSGFNMESGDKIRLGLCYPKNVTSFSFSGGFPNINDLNQAISVSNIEDLNEDTTGRAYFHDRSTGLLFINLISFADRIAHETCPANDCDPLIITRTGGHNNLVDCSAEAYDGTYNVAEDTATASDIPTAKACTTLSDSSAYGAPVETAFFSAPSPASLTCPADSDTGRLDSKYKGCYLDDMSLRDLPEEYNRLGMGMTVEFCVDRCYARGYTYAGLQHGKDCRCGNLYGGYGTTNNCTNDCGGNQSQICGGKLANSVYSTGKPEPANFTKCGPNDEGVLINNKCFYLDPTAVNYTMAQRACAVLGGNLATIDSAEIQFEVQRYMYSMMATAWIGLHDLVEDTNYQWVDGTSGGYRNFISGQGTSPGPDCVALMADKLFGWDDRSISETNRPLCVITTDPPTHVSCGYNNYGQSVNGGECYAVYSNVSYKYQDADYLCASRRGVVADASDDTAFEDIKSHLILFAGDVVYSVAEKNDVYTELSPTKLFNKGDSSANDKNGVVCRIETVPVGQCSTGWIKTADSCYFTTRRKHKYSTYQGLCNQGVSSVLTINSETENTFIANLVRTANSNPLVYLGYVYEAASSQFVWERGTSSEELWGSGQGAGNIVKGECAVLKTAESDTTWRNRICSKSAMIVCEAPLAD